MDYLRPIGIGLVAGMRSLTAPAVVSDRLARSRNGGLVALPVRLLQSPAVAAALKVMAAGELVADKTPGIPARIEPLPLAARAATGALSGAAVAAADGESAATGALLGGLAAVVATYGMYHLRRRLAEALPVPDALLGLAEDALAVAVARQVLSNGARPAEG
jgi:uncharacterized membrane protein